MKRLLFLLGLSLLVVPPAGLAEGRIGTVPRSVWKSVHHARDVLAIPVLQQAVAQWSADRQDHILIQYQGGNAQARQAGRLRGWLIALGVPGSAIQLLPGAAAGTGLLVSVGF